MTRISQTDQKKQLQSPIMFSNGSVVFLNILVTLFLYFIRIQDPKPYSHFKLTSQKAYFSHLCLYKGYNGKWIKNVIFHDFFKVLLDVLRWYCRYVEMFLEHLGGVLNLRTYFWPHCKSPGNKDFSHPNSLILKAKFAKKSGYC